MTSPNQISAPRALLVDGRVAFADLLRWNFEKNGFVVECASSGEEVLRQTHQFRPDLVLLNCSLPGLNAFEVCHRLRTLPETGNLAVIMTGCAGDQHLVRALGAGADDYLVEPFGTAELLARVRAVFRRTRADPARVSLRLGELDLDLTASRVRRNGRHIHISPTEFNLLRVLMLSPNRVFSREEIIDLVWSGNAAVGQRTVDVHVRRLREAIGPNVIRTVRSAGYVLDAT